MGKGKASRVIQLYILREILGFTLLSTIVLTSILLYGNLSKFDEDLFLALSISPILFIELISLMLPFALSLGLPFGFSLAVVFCVGRWSADREILALQSLGVRRLSWSNPIFFSSIIISAIGCIASLHLSPLSRSAFENRVKELGWQDFEKWIDDGREIPFEVGEKDGKNLLGGLNAGSGQKIKQASFLVGHGYGNQWKNVRILMWGENRQLLAVINAKESTVVKDREKGEVELFLYGVDYESFEKSGESDTSTSNFVSFERWKQPIRFSIGSPNIVRDMKRVPIGEFLNLHINNNLSTADAARGYSHFNKYASIACSPISLCSLLIFVAVRSGRRETYANLFIGVLVCLLFFIFGSTLGRFIGPNGIGWWLSNLIAFTAGFLLIK